MENSAREQRQQRHHKKRPSTPADASGSCSSSHHRRSRASSARASSSARRLAAASANPPSSSTRDHQRRSFALVMEQIPSFRGLNSSFGEDDCEREDVTEDSHHGRSTPSPGVQRPSLQRRSTVDEYVSKSIRSHSHKNHHQKASSDASVSSKSVSNHNNNTTTTRSSSKNRSNSKTRRNGSRRHSRTSGQPRSSQKKQQQQKLREVLGKVNQEVDLDEDDTIADWESSSVYNPDVTPHHHHHHHHSQNSGSRRHSRTTGHRSTLQKKQQKQLQQAIRDVNRELATMDFGENDVLDAALEPTNNGCQNNNNNSRRHSRTAGHRSTLQKKQQQQLQQVIQDINKDMTIDDDNKDYNPWEAMIDTGIPETKVTLHRVSDVDDDVLFHADFSCCASGNNSKPFQQGPSAHTRSTHTQSTHTRASFSTEGSQETEDPFFASSSAAIVSGKSCSALDFDGDAESTDFFSQLASASATKNMNASPAFIQDPTELPSMVSPKVTPKASVASKYSSLAGRVALKSPIAGAGRRRTGAKGQPLASRDGFRTAKKTSDGSFLTNAIAMLPLHHETNEGIPTSPVAKDKSKSFHPRSSMLSPDAPSSPRPRRRNSLGNQQDSDGQLHPDAKSAKDQQHHPHMWSLSNLVAMTMPHGKLGRQNQQRQKLQPRYGKQEQNQDMLPHNFFGDDAVVAQQ